MHAEYGVILHHARPVGFDQRRLETRELTVHSCRYRRFQIGALQYVSAERDEIRPTARQRRLESHAHHAVLIKLDPALERISAAPLEEIAGDDQRWVLKLKVAGSTV